MINNVKVITRALKAAGLDPNEFISKELGLKYTTFTYRVRNDSLKKSDYAKILQATGKTFEELFMPPPVGHENSSPVNLPPEKYTLEEIAEVAAKVFDSPPARQQKREPVEAPFEIVEIDFSSFNLND